MTLPTMPHCDPSILHAPSKCIYCDRYPQYQEYREAARIAFTGEDDELGIPWGVDTNGLYEAVAPCPSTWFRNPQHRDAWGGNRPDGYTWLEGLER
jgi:hypothetical protein